MRVRVLSFVCAAVLVCAVLACAGYVNADTETLSGFQTVTGPTLSTDLPGGVAMPDWGKNSVATADGWKWSVAGTDTWYDAKYYAWSTGTYNGIGFDASPALDTYYIFRYEFTFPEFNFNEAVVREEGFDYTFISSSSFLSLSGLFAADAYIAGIWIGEGSTFTPKIDPQQIENTKSFSVVGNPTADDANYIYFSLFNDTADVGFRFVGDIEVVASYTYTYTATEIPPDDTTTPEPATLLIFGAGVSGAVLTRLYRRKRK